MLHCFILLFGRGESPKESKEYYAWLA